MANYVKANPWEAEYPMVQGSLHYLVSNEKKVPGCLEYNGQYTTHVI